MRLIGYFVALGFLITIMAITFAAILKSDHRIVDEWFLVGLVCGYAYRTLEIWLLKRGEKKNAE